MQALPWLDISDTPIDWVKLARNGINKQMLLQMQNQMSLSQRDIASLLHLSPRTIQRMGDEDVLPPAASGQAVEMMRIYQRTIEVLGSSILANQWLITPIDALNHVSPLSLLDTPVGTQWVFTILGRIEYGIYS